MKSSFSRSFFPAIAILLMALLTVGFSFQMLARNVMEKRTMERLKTEADTVSRLAAAYYNHSTDRENEFFITLSVVTQVSGSDAVICDANGILKLCSDAPMGCDHQGLQIGRDYLNRVLSAGYTESTGMGHRYWRNRRTGFRHRYEPCHDRAIRLSWRYRHVHRHPCRSDWHCSGGIGLSGL